MSNMELAEWISSALCPKHAAGSGLDRVPLDRLRLEDSPRLGGVDAGHVRALADVDRPLPPIVVHHETMQVIDGMHRVSAARLKNEHDIAVVYFCGSVKEAFRLAVLANVEHGMPLTVTDRHAAAERIVQSHPQLSDRSIASGTGIAARTVAGIRRRMTAGGFAQSRIGQDGRTRPLSTAEGRRRASEIIAERPGASLREIAREAGLSVGTVRDVRARMARGDDPIPADRPAGRASAVDRVRKRTADAIDVSAALEVLRRDPALRYSEAGRALLRWLAAGAVSGPWRDVLDLVPPHCTPLIATVMRSCARSWDRLADQLDQQCVG
jgi:hypothetical protein